MNTKRSMPSDGLETQHINHLCEVDDNDSCLFPCSIIAKAEGTLHTVKAQEFPQYRVEYMKTFLERIDKELKHEA